MNRGRWGMSMKYGVLNLLAIGLVLFLSSRNYEVWTHPLEWKPENVGGRNWGEGRRPLR